MRRRDYQRASSFSPIRDEEIVYLESLAAELRRLRSERGISRSVLAKWAGFSVEHLRCLEDGTRRPRRSTLAILAHCLKGDLAELVRLTGPALAKESKSSRLRTLRPLPPEPPPAPPRPPKRDPEPPAGRWWPEPEGEDVWDDPRHFFP